MKRSTCAGFLTLALLIPTLAAAQGVELVYRPELRGLVPVPGTAVKSQVAAERPSPTGLITRHTAMAQTYRGTRIAQAAVHCDRIVREARAELRGDN